MRKIEISSKFNVYPSLKDTPVQVQKLMLKAIEAREKAYAPYSKFNVGAAVLLDNGKIVTGNNQENASYPSGLCAERTAVYAANANFPESKMRILTITAASCRKETEIPIPPCGACRQVIAEYETRQDAPIEIYFMGKKGEVVCSESLANLLPFIFDKSAL
ncbi:MAG: cytidine deaminase [Flavobacteriaceae bacterium]|nr:cytidine deaminase [Flavobacteriaceae bacterium]